MHIISERVLSRGIQPATKIQKAEVPEQESHESAPNFSHVVPKHTVEGGLLADVMRCTASGHKHLLGIFKNSVKLSAIHVAASCNM